MRTSGHRRKSCCISSCIRPRHAPFRCKDVMLDYYDGVFGKRACKNKIIVDEVEDVREALHIMRSMKDSVVSSGDVEVKWRKEAPMHMDLGGMTQTFIELRTDLVLQLSRELGVRPMVGLLLHGLPGSGSGPGSGKTRFAQAIAYESGFNFYPLSATELVSGVSGVAFEENIIIRELFAMAKRTAPSVVFIDDIDAIASKRVCLETRFVTMARQLTICIDEAHDDYLEASDEDSPGDYVLVIGATNRLDVIEPALRRPGRFDREILVTIPHESVLRSEPADDDEDWKREPWLPKEIDLLAIEMMPGFEEAPEVAQPSFPNVKWEDVGGLDLLKHEFDLHILRRTQCPEAEHDEGFGMNLETAFLLYGPPGCGKTLIAKAVANEAGANFIHVKEPELLNKYVGESEPVVRDMFSHAREGAPCILFFDEVDALTTERGKEGGRFIEGLLNQLLIELDGAEQRRGVFVIGATNRPEVMDRAVFQPGRFGKLLYVPLPSPDDRVLILKALAKDMPVDASVDLSAIGRLKACENFSGADLAALMNEASMAALKETLTLTETTSATLTTIKTAHFEVALSKVFPSVSDTQRQFYQHFSESLKAA